MNNAATPSSLEGLKTQGYVVMKNKYAGTCTCGARVAVGAGRLLTHPRVPGTRWLLCTEQKNRCSKNFGKGPGIGSPDDEQ